MVGSSKVSPASTSVRRPTSTLAMWYSEMCGGLGNHQVSTIEIQGSPSKLRESSVDHGPQLSS